MLVTPIESKTKYITVARQVLLKSMRESSVIVFTQVTGLVAIVPSKTVTKFHACLTAKGVIDAYQERSIFITIANFGKVAVSMRMHLEVGKVASVPRKIVSNKDNRFWYTSDAIMTERDSSVHAVQYKSIPYCLEKLTEHEAIKQTDKEAPKKDWKESV